MKGNISDNSEVMKANYNKNPDLSHDMSGSLVPIIVELKSILSSTQSQ